MTIPRLELSRDEILTYRRRVSALDQRLPPGKRSLRQAAWAGIQDSMPRAALLSIHARVNGTKPTSWEDPSLVQLWGPRYSTYVVATSDIAVFTLSRMPESPEARRRAEDTAARLAAFLDGRKMGDAEVGRALGRHPSSLRYAAPTGTVLIRWEGARQPTIWTIPPPEVNPGEARLEMARRYLHVFGPGTPSSFGAWAGIRAGPASETFRALRRSLTPVLTPIGDAWILSKDEDQFRAPSSIEAPARLLPSGDTYFLLQGRDRELLVSEAEHRRDLWPSRVWPGAVLVEGRLVGTWRRAKNKVSVNTWSRLSRSARQAVEAEAASLPLPGDAQDIVVSWG